MDLVRGDPNLKIYFVFKNEIVYASDDMNQAFTYTQDYMPKCKWINELQAIDMVTIRDLTKKDVFVLESFTGQTFEELQRTKCLILGPRCLLVCLLECKPIPRGNTPVFVTSMRDLTICVSGFDANEKNNLKTLISYMGGYYVKDLTGNINYLVSNTIKSTKYEHAVMNKRPVMHSNWISAVWEASQTETILATDCKFAKYKLPIFYNAQITTSALSVEMRNKIKTAITENGGIFQKSFKSSETDILITTKDGADSDKYKAAIKYKKDILLPDWVFNSVKKGFSLPFKTFKVSGIKASTPTKLKEIEAEFTPNSTQMSEISQIERPDSKNISSNESIISTVSCLSTSSITTNTTTNTTTNMKPIKLPYHFILQDICSANIKNAGSFLEDCSVYLSGFNNSEKEKLNKILNSGAATRYNEVNDNVTHVIVGQHIPEEYKSWRNKTGASIVNLGWIKESIKNKQPAREFNFLVELPVEIDLENSSPQSKKSLKSLNHTFKKPQSLKRKLDFNETVKLRNKDNSDETSLLQQYSQENPIINNIDLDIERDDTVINNNRELIKKITQNEEVTQGSLLLQNSSCQDYEKLDFFDGLTVYIDQHYDHELYTQTITDCEAARGHVVNPNYRDEVDYAIVSVDKAFLINSLPIKAKRIVNNLWMEDAIKYNKLVEIEYYHKPINLNATKKPLEELVIVLSTYKQTERFYLESLINIMGGYSKDQYVRKDCAILVCPSPEGNKYKAAIKWENPVVNSSWLVDCSETGTQMELESYLVGAAKGKSFRENLRSNHNENVMNIPKSNENILTVLETDHQNCMIDILPLSSKQPFNNYTPLRHKRVEELLGSKEKRSTCVGTPIEDNNLIADIASNYVGAFDDLDDFLKDISDEEVRDCCKEELLKIKNAETPEIDRYKKLTKTPGNSSPATPHSVPDFCKTPEFRRRMLEFVEKRLNVPQIKHKPHTPLSEIKNRLWRETLPDEFLAKFPKFQNQIQNSELITTTKCNEFFENEKMENDIGDAEFEPNELLSPAIKVIKDFIKNRDSVSKKSFRRSCIEESQGVPCPLESELIFNSERMVGWAEPSELKTEHQNQNRMIFPGEPKFSASSIQEEEKIRLMRKIEIMGGKMCVNLNTYDPTCTHILCEKPNRSEKLLSGIAAGKWILNLNYIEDSFKQGNFLNEETYEWGNPVASHISQLALNDQMIAKTSYYWRNKISTTKCKGAFEGFRVILHLPEKSKNSFKMVIESGGGEVLLGSPPYDDQIVSQATHVFVDKRKTTLNRTEHLKFIKAGVHVLTNMFISTYLTSDPDTEPKIHNLTLSN